MSDRGWRTEIKRPSKDARRSEAYDPAICGRRDPGTLAYQVLEEGEPLSADAEPYCEGCRATQVATIQGAAKSGAESAP